MANRYIARVRRCSLCRKNLRKEEKTSAREQCKKVLRDITASRKLIRREEDSGDRYLEKLAARDGPYAAWNKEKPVKTVLTISGHRCELHTRYEGNGYAYEVHLDGHLLCSGWASGTRTEAIAEAKEHAEKSLAR